MNVGFGFGMVENPLVNRRYRFGLGGMARNRKGVYREPFSCQLKIQVFWGKIELYKVEWVSKSSNEHLYYRKF
jgi:hypothetical protein